MQALRRHPFALAAAFAIEDESCANVIVAFTAHEIRDRAARELLPLCLALQTVLFVSMNFFELRYARDLLLSPRWMLCANAGFLALGWFVALNAR